MSVSVQVCFDTADPDRAMRFWCEAMGYRPDAPPPGFATWEDWLRAHGIPEANWNDRSGCSDAEGVGPRLFFQRVPEGKVAKNRCHLDLNVGGGRGVPVDERRRRIEVEAARLVGLGATLLGVHEEMGECYANLQDPEGNEFDLQ